MKTLLTEMVRKECEQYRLVEFGLLNSVEEGVDILLSVLPPGTIGQACSFSSFPLWRGKALNRFYSKIRYSDFLRSRCCSAEFIRFLYFFQQRLLVEIRRRYHQPTLDNDLALPPRTIAFKLSPRMQEEHRERLVLKVQRLKSAGEMQMCCRCFLKNHFPLDWPTLVKRLKKEDESYWQELYCLIKKLAGSVTLRLYPSLQYRREIEQDTWSDASLFLREKVRAGDLSLWENALHFRHYILRICVNKCHEAGRYNRMKNMVWETDQIPFCLEEEIDEGGKGETENEEKWADIDPEDNAAVSRALTAVLWDRTEPWYSRVTEGQEEKVRILFLRYVSGKSYAEIVRMQRGMVPPEQARKEENKLRQEVVRIRKLLKQRFISLLQTQNTRWNHGSL